MSALSELTDAGFTHTATFLRRDGVASLVGAAPDAAGLYALVLRNEVRYIASSQRPLSSRLNALRRRLRRASERPLVQALARALREGDVRVLTYELPAATLANAPYDLAAAYERDLVRLLRPAWNSLESSSGASSSWRDLGGAAMR